MMKKESGSMLYLVGLSVIAALGGFLFGYDTAIISGTISHVNEQFDLNLAAQGWFVSSALVGCVAGVAGAGILSDRFGRKISLLLAALLFLASAIGCMLSPSHSFLISSRLLGGIGVGIASMLSPLYIAEIAPPKIRGRLVALYQFAITLGILVAYFANAWLQKNSLNPDVELSGTMELVFKNEVWRGMLGSESIPALGFFILILLVPESPRWMVLKGKEKEAHHTLERINGKIIADEQISSIKNTLKDKGESIRSMVKQGFLFPLIIGSILAISSQLSGINAIIYYGPSILNEAGFKLSDALGGQVIIGICNVVFTLLAIWKIDQMGRKSLLTTGLTGMIFFLTAVGFLFFLGVSSGTLLLIFILGFIAFFAFSYGPVIWVLLSEIYPTRYRGRAMSVATLILWGGNVFVGQLVPWSLENLGTHWTFWAFAIMTIPALYIAARLLPETKGKSLEEIEQFWKTRARK